LFEGIEYQDEPKTRSKEPYIPSKEPNIHSKEPYIASKRSHILSTEKVLGTKMTLKDCYMGTATKKYTKNGLGTNGK